MLKCRTCHFMRHGYWNFKFAVDSSLNFFAKNWRFISTCSRLLYSCNISAGKMKIIHGQADNPNLWICFFLFSLEATLEEHFLCLSTQAEVNVCFALQLINEYPICFLQNKRGLLKYFKKQLNGTTKV